MRLLLDENLSRRLVPLLKGVYPGISHVADYGLLTSDDEQVWTYARDHDLVIVSKDSDFYFRALSRGFPPKVVWLRVGNARTGEIAAVLISTVDEVRRFQQDDAASVLVLP